MRRAGWWMAALLLPLALLLPSLQVAQAQVVTVDTAATARHQVIDGFGACCGALGAEEWYAQLFLDDAAFSILRMDITPAFTQRYSALQYCSPWFGQPPPLRLDDGGNGPDGSRTRPYTGAADYSRRFGGCSAPIAVMGPDIDANVKAFDFSQRAAAGPGALARRAMARKDANGRFRLYGSLWSPAPWLKVRSGNRYDAGAEPPLPARGTPFPFIWGGNFAGGALDTSGTPRAEFDDTALGGNGPTSALTQFARGLAAWLRGFQEAYGVRFDAISIQNELSFEQFYNSARYARAPGYIKALLAARAELDRYPDLAGIRITGPEDVMGGSAYQLWQLGSGRDTSHKNLQFIAAVQANPEAARALSFFSVHAYAADGINPAGADATTWRWWADGWNRSPAPGLPARASGFTDFGKKSWMTEASGEDPAWLWPADGTPDGGGWGIASKIQLALTAGRQNAWVYWQLANDDAVARETLTDEATGAASPKYVALKHFSRYIRPGAVRVEARVDGSDSLAASAFLHEADDALTVVLINRSRTPANVALQLPAAPAGIKTLQTHASSEGHYWQPSTVDAAGGTAAVTVPGFGIVTLHGSAATTR